MKVELAKAKCAKCGKEFSYPQLGDFAYGDFIFSGERGSVHAHFQAIDSPVWKFLDSTLPSSETARDAESIRGDKLQAACAYFADPVQGQRLCNYIVCPRCECSQLTSWGEKQTGVMHVAAASFSQFMALSEPERRRLAIAHFEAKRADPSRDQ